VSCGQHLELRLGDEPCRRARHVDPSEWVVVTPQHERRHGQPPQLIRVHAQRTSEAEGGEDRSKLGEIGGRGDRVVAGRDERLDQIRVTHDRVLLAQRRHQPNDLLRIGLHHARQHVSDHWRDHHSQERRRTGAG
jgi:hypothetical protein